MKKVMIYFPKINKFDEDSIWGIKLPIPIPEDLYKELYEKGIIPKEDLVKDKYYFGKCRNATIAKWCGNEFVYIRHKFGESFLENINHIEDDNEYDLFIPLKEIIPTEEQKIKN